MLWEHKLGVLIDAHTPNQEADEEDGAHHTQDASPKGSQQTEGRDVSSQASVDDRATTADRHLKALS